MKKMKRLIAYILCFSMVAGLFPMTAAAAERAINEPLEQNVVIEGVTTEARTVYVLTDSLANGEKYLISNKSLTGGAETGVVLVKNGTNIGYETIQVKEGTIEATNENTYSNEYIELENPNAVWTVERNNRSWRLSNDGDYLGTNNSGTLSLGNAANWTYSNQRLTRDNRYLYFNSESMAWATRQNASNVYFYQEVTAESVEGQDIVYKVQAEDLEHVLDLAAAGYSDVAQLDYAFLKDGQEMTTPPADGSYAFEIMNDENDIISSIAGDGTVKFNPVEGTADVKISYTWTEGGETYTAYKYVEVYTTEPSYGIDVTYNDESVTQTVVIKGVTNETTYQLGYNASYTGKDGKVPVTPAAGSITWTTNRPDLATVDENGLVHFKAANGVVQITVVYTYETGKSVTDTAAFSISVEQYITPEDGTGAFPEYPNEGSVRFDKTASAVGTFSETGIAEMELSMTGVPYTEGNTMDVVLMLDHSSSMTEARMAATRAATEVFIKNIVMNTDGSFNNNRIYIGSFAGGNPDYAGQTRHEFKIYEMTTNEQDGYQIVNDQAELETLIGNVNSVFVKMNNPPYGTEYAQSLQRCYEILRASKEDENKQFCVFMSDGIPNVYKYGDGANDRVTSSNAMTQMFRGNNYDTRDTDYQYEYYSSLMKADGVTVFTVGLGLYGTNSALGNASAVQCENVSNILLNDISGPAGEVAADRDTGSTISKENEYFYSVADEDAAEEMGNVFGDIAQKIQEAAKDVRVTDKIADKYTMVFDFPNDDVEGKLAGSNQEFYIEAKEYDLIPQKDEDGEIVDYNRTGTPNSLLKVYMGVNPDGSYFAAKDAAGTRHDAPVFAERPLGTEFYWTTDAAKGDADIAITSGETTYYFVAAGNGTHNMISGAYAYGMPKSTEILKEEKDPVTGEVTMTNMGENKTCQDLIIATPYFVYNAETRMLVWTAEKLSTKEITLTYFLYLENSGGYVGNYGETPEGTYDTNDFADLNYTNFQGVECEQKFPVPQMTWNGAQVSYVFYLVNKDGIPVNSAGRRVPFSEAVYVTDTYTYAVTWNDENMSGSLEANYLASELVPDVYELYDKKAAYQIYVYETEDSVNKNNHFVIGGDANLAKTTHVFNRKADATKYTALGQYSAANVDSGFDFANTTVAFAVLWKPELVEDVVVIDYGLPVDINVMANDNVAGALVGLQEAYSGLFKDIEINKGVLPPRLTALPTRLECGDSIWAAMKFGDVEIISNTSVRYTPKSMVMDDYDLFHYVATMNYYDTDGTLLSPSMYSSVKVIPANNVYFEDTTTFVEYTGNWEQAGAMDASAKQDTDRPGESKISDALDKDNIYGYDSAYVANDTYSLGGAHKVTVSAADQGNWPTAKFTFTGTAFDVISLTSNQTGTITVEVVNDDNQKVGSWFVDTYYGYTYIKDETNPYLKINFVYGNDGLWHATSTKPVPVRGEEVKAPSNPKVGDRFVVYEENGKWVVSTNADNALYQIPVIKSPEMAYDTYTVTITARYADGFNHIGDDSYDFYLDGIRTYNPVSTDVKLENGDVYDPTPENTTVGDIYLQDGEAYPVYAEIRENLLKQNSFDASLESVDGALFIDGLGNLGETTREPQQEQTPSNVALGKTVTAGNMDGTAVHINTNGGPSLANLTDGAKTQNPYDYTEIGYASAEGTKGVSYLQVDLGTFYDISELKMWRYFDNRTYGETVIAIAESEADFPENLTDTTYGATVVYNSDVATESFFERNFGKGTDSTYAETDAGYTITLDEAVTGRYVRIYLTGRNDNNRSHVVEFEAYGVETKPAIPEISADKITVSMSGTAESTKGGVSKGVQTSAEEAKGYLFDGNNKTFWRSNEVAKIEAGNPYLQLDLNRIHYVSKVMVGPRWDDTQRWNCTGNVRNLSVEVSTDGENWTTVTPEGGQAISTDMASTDMAEIAFEEVSARYIRLSGTSSYHWQEGSSNTSISFAELAVYGEQKTEISEYEAYGPNNEVYLKRGQAVAFRIEDANAANYVAAHLGVKSPNGGDVKVTVASGTKSVDVTTSSATEQYYDISEVVSWNGSTSEVIIITNTSEAEVMVSLTNVKVTHGAAGAAQTIDLKVYPNDAAYAAAFVYDQYVNSIPRIPLSEVCELFLDVEHDAWYEDAVQYVYEEDILLGNGNRFSPHDDVTRAMVAMILYRLEGSPEVTDYTKYNKFTDLPAEKDDIWYTDAVAWALNVGLATGDDVNMKYNPDAPVTREQLATFLWRYVQYIGEDVTVTAAEEELLGDTYVSEWAKDGFVWAVEKGLIKGAEMTDAAGNTYYDLSPQGSAARAQMAVILTRFGEAYGL